jgi:hypothetical protein
MKTRLMKFDQRNWLFRNEHGEVFRIIKIPRKNAPHLPHYVSFDGYGDKLTEVSFSLNDAINQINSIGKVV